MQCENNYMRSINSILYRGHVHRMNLTATVYICNDVSVCWDEKGIGRALRTGTRIPKGTLIVLEHCLSGTTHDVSVGIAADPKLFRELAPRSDGWPTKSEGVRKANRNAFASRIKEEYLVSTVISSINHSCFPNCTKGVIMRDYSSSKIPCDFMYIYTLRDISPREELTIMYSNRDKIHTNPIAGFKCICNAPPGTEMPRDDVDERPDALKMALEYLDDRNRSAKVITNQEFIRKIAHNVDADKPVETYEMPLDDDVRVFEIMKLLGMDVHTVLNGQVMS